MTLQGTNRRIQLLMVGEASPLPGGEQDRIFYGGFDISAGSLGYVIVEGTDPLTIVDANRVYIRDRAGDMVVDTLRQLGRRYSPLMMAVDAEPVWLQRLKNDFDVKEPCNSRIAIRGRRRLCQQWIDEEKVRAEGWLKDLILDFSTREHRSYPPDMYDEALALVINLVDGQRREREKIGWLNSPIPKTTTDLSA